MATTLESLPSETIINILSFVPDTDLLAVRLTSRVLLTHSKKSNGTYIVDLRKRLDHHEHNIVHVTIERSWPKKKKLDIRICTTCHKLKPRDCFSDGQWKQLAKNIHFRDCTICSLERFPLEPHNFRYLGKHSFTCNGCLKIRLLDDEVRWVPYRSAERQQLEHLRHVFQTQRNHVVRFCHHCVTFCVEEEEAPSGYSILANTLDMFNTLSTRERFNRALGDYTVDAAQPPTSAT